MSRRLRILQVGAGARAQSHLAAMRTCAEVEIVGLCELDAARLNSTADTFGITACYSDMAHAIADTQPDLVDIVTPPQIRLSIVHAAVAAGAPAILIEKPIALTPSESRALAALGTERLIAVNTQYQWMPHWQQIWRLLQAKHIGDVCAIRASTRVNILEQGPHILDLALHAAHVSGLPAPQWLQATCTGIEYFGTTPVPADTSAVIGLGDARLWLNAGSSAPEVPNETGLYYQQQVDILGTTGRIWVSLNQGWRMWDHQGLHEGATGWPHDDGLAQHALFQHLHHVLVGDGDWRHFPTRIAVAARNQDLMFACYAASQRGQRVELPQEWDDTIVTQVATV
jgi:predicted dehydrogenase